MVSLAQGMSKEVRVCNACFVHAPREFAQRRMQRWVPAVLIGDCGFSSADRSGLGIWSGQVPQLVEGCSVEQGGCFERGRGVVARHYQRRPASACGERGVPG
jgi:hypothetical protein